MFLDEILAQGVTIGLGIAGTNFFKGAMPPTPVACVSILDYAGEGPDTTLGTAGITEEYPRFQLLSRAPTLDAARAKAQTAFEEYAKVKNTTLSSTFYGYIKPIASVSFLHYDKNDAPVFVVNFETMRRVS